MQRAMKLRGFQPKNISRRNLQVFAQLTGSILVRSYERSLRIYQAMILRGYGYQPQNKKQKAKFSLNNIFRHGDRYSLRATLITSTTAMFLIALQILVPSF